MECEQGRQISLRAHQGKDLPKPELPLPGCESASSPLRKPQRTGQAGSSFSVSGGAMDPSEILCCFSKVIAGLDLVLLKMRNASVRNHQAPPQPGTSVHTYECPAHGWDSGPMRSRNGPRWGRSLLLESFFPLHFCMWELGMMQIGKRTSGFKAYPRSCRSFLLSLSSFVIIV